MPPKKQPPDEATQLRTQIESLTGRKLSGPSAKNVRYLRRRLADVERRMSEGHNVRIRNEGAQTLTISLSARGAAALSKVLKNLSTDRSALARSALARSAIAGYVRSLGYSDEAAAIETVGGPQ